MDAVNSCAAAETFCDCPADSLLTFSISRTEVTMCSLPLAISPIAVEIPATWVDTSSVSCEMSRKVTPAAFTTSMPILTDPVDSSIACTAFWMSVLF